MLIEKFKQDFKRLGGVYITRKVVLLRKPLELYSLVGGFYAAITRGDGKLLMT